MIMNEALPLDTFLPYNINVLARRISCSLSYIYQSEFGITIPQWRVLVWVDYYDTLTAKEICDYTRMDKTQVSRSVEQLVRAKLVSRHPIAEDQRSIALRLTRQGKQLLAKIIPQALSWEAQLVQILTSEERTQLQQILKKLDQQLDTINNCPQEAGES